MYWHQSERLLVPKPEKETFQACLDKQVPGPSVLYTEHSIHLNDINPTRPVWMWRVIWAIVDSIEFKLMLIKVCGKAFNLSSTWDMFIFLNSNKSRESAPLPNFDPMHETHDWYNASFYVNKKVLVQRAKCILCVTVEILEGKTRIITRGWGTRNFSCYIGSDPHLVFAPRKKNITLTYPRKYIFPFCTSTLRRTLKIQLTKAITPKYTF